MYVYFHVTVENEGRREKRKQRERKKRDTEAALVNGLKGYREPVGGRRAETVGRRAIVSKGASRRRKKDGEGAVNHRVTRPTRTPFASVPTGAILP